MPSLKKIVVQNFRNIELQELEFSGKLNCFTGGNGEGKTNLLDAIWYLSMTKSAFTADRFNFRYGSDFFALSGTYSIPGRQDTRISIHVDGDKKLKRDDKVYQRISDHIGLIPIVMVSPSDVSMVSDSGEERRRFANSVISQIDSEYLVGMQQYNRLLAQRNRLLKEFRPDLSLLDVIDDKIDVLSLPLSRKREAFAKGLNPRIKDFYSKISGGRENVSVRYRSELQKSGMKDLLSARRERDLLLGYTTVGLQRDDFSFEMNGHPIRNCGSQGQQKSFLVALKFAQYAIMREGLSEEVKPILLLDDLFDKLDLNRVQNLLQMVLGEDFGQIFLTDSNKLRISNMVDSITEDRSYFEAKGGVFMQL